MFFRMIFWRAGVCWPLLCFFRVFERCPVSISESCRSKQARYQLRHPSPYKLSHPFSWRMLPSYCIKRMGNRILKEVSGYFVERNVNHIWFFFIIFLFVNGSSRMRTLQPGWNRTGSWKIRSGSETRSDIFRNSNFIVVQVFVSYINK